MSPPRPDCDSFSLAGGAIVDDFDNDGRLDVVTSSFDSCAPMRFFRRLADGRFSEQGAKAGLGDQLGGLNVGPDRLRQRRLSRHPADARGVGPGAAQVAAAQQLQRDGFTDVTVASGLAQPATSTQAAVWTDIDNDGFLDLFVGNEASAAQLFLNKRDGTFDEIGAAAGVARTAFSKGVAAADYDNDGWPDLYVSNLSGDNFLYRNNRDGTFTELGRGRGRAGLAERLRQLVLRLRQRRLAGPVRHELFTSVEETARTYLGLPNNATTLKLYRNLGDGSFLDVTTRSRPRQGVHADGRELRRHRQRRLPRHLSRNGESLVRLAGAQRAAAQRGGQVVRRRHRFLRHRRVAQGTRRRVRRSRQRRRRGDRLRGRRCRRPEMRTRLRLFREPGARQRLAGAPASSA